MSHETQPPTKSSSPGIDSTEPSLSQTHPYRTPANVGDSMVAAGALKSPLLWIIVAATTAFVVVGAFILVAPVRDFNGNRRPVKPIPQYVEDFGASRLPAEDYENMGEIPDGQPDTLPPAPVGAP